MDISHTATVVLMGELDGKKAKDKWMEMKTCGLLIVAGYRTSGNGDGRRADGERDHSTGEDDEPIVSSENDYSNYLNGRGPHNLYFLKHIAIHEIVCHSIQQLNRSNRLDGSSIPSARGHKKRKGTDNGEYLTLTAMTETNGQMGILNETMLESKIEELDEKVMDIRTRSWKMEMERAPAEHIEFVKSHLERAERKMKDLEQRLDELRTT